MSEINIKDNITITPSAVQFNCRGCIYQTSTTAVNLKSIPCNICARAYKDYYESTAVPLKNDNK